jgi:hypothetical protein
MKRERTADRLLDALVIGLVVTVLGFVAGAPRAARDATPTRYSIVEAPASACTNAAPAQRRACLRLARASLARP